MNISKNTKFHHSVTENGNLQLRIITEYQDDEGKVLDKKYSDPMTPADTSKMDGWDDRSKAIVEAITDPDTRAEFESHQQLLGPTGFQSLVTYDRIIDDLGRISIRKISRIFDEGEEVSKKYHRSWIMPGQDPAGNDVMSKAIAEKLHTTEVIAAYNAKMAEIKEASELK